MVQKRLSTLNIEGIDLYGGTRHSTLPRSENNSLLNRSKHSTNKAFDRFLHVQSDDALSIYVASRSGKQKRQVKNFQLTVII